MITRRMMLSTDRSTAVVIFCLLHSVISVPTASQETHMVLSIYVQSYRFDVSQKELKAICSDFYTSQLIYQVCLFNSTSNHCSQKQRLYVSPFKLTQFTNKMSKQPLKFVTHKSLIEQSLVFKLFIQCHNNVSLLDSKAWLLVKPEISPWDKNKGSPKVVEICLYREHICLGTTLVWKMLAENVESHGVIGGLAKDFKAVNYQVNNIAYSFPRNKTKTYREWNHVANEMTLGKPGWTAKSIAITVVVSLSFVALLIGSALLACRRPYEFAPTRSMELHNFEDESIDFSCIEDGSPWR